MKALCYHGKHDIRCDNVPDPTIEDPRDAIVRVTSCAICGSDLHLYDGFMPGMVNGDIVGHEFMGEVVEVGAENRKLKVGDRVVVPFTIVCGDCDQCRRGNFSVCERTNRKKELAEKAFGHTTAGLFGYTHLTGGYAGGQAEYVRVPFADVGPVKVPDGMSDEQALFLGDIFPTGWQAAVQCDIQPDDTVAIWGAGPVGQFCVRSAVLLGARQVVMIDNVPERLAMAEAGGATAINFDEESVLERLGELTGGKGPEKCIDAVGLEAHATRSLDSIYDRVKQA
ncbi:MAG TPA: alcohol dehydrogenase catalytic domain-containing protein, partial [Propylenella sp.]|nr:alcohol dehydrogenase catalytic domain-containing protein [Propylenella sp.]